MSEPPLTLMKVLMSSLRNTNALFCKGTMRQVVMVPFLDVRLACHQCCAFLKKGAEDARG